MLLQRYMQHVYYVNHLSACDYMFILYVFLFMFCLDLLQRKKKTKKVIEKYWDWELTNETKPIWVSFNSSDLVTSIVRFFNTLCLRLSLFCEWDFFVAS